ncbi:MAG: DUF2505 domain-containing protein [Solirubrobacteraceae bacterium]|nr:DUF2505 domain-containing protein [Solirubrobacteraceae bacterium]
MSKSFTVQATYAAGADAVWAVVTDPVAVKEKFEALGAKEVEVLEHDATGDVVRFKVRRKEEVDVPSFAKKIAGPSNTVNLDETWRRDGDRLVAEWSAEISPARVSLVGTRTVTPDGDGVREVIAAEAKANVPLIGGKLADFAANETSKALAEDQVWIAARVAG